MKKLIRATSLAAAGVVLSSAAFAQAYVGIGAGMSKWTDDCDGVTSCDKTGSGMKALFGYKLSPNLAAEVAVMDFGKLTGKVGASTLSIKGSLVGVGAAFTGELAPGWEGVARLGLASAKAKVSAPGFSDSDSSTTAYAGLGLGYMVNKNLSVDCAVDFSNVKYEGAKDNVSLFSVGLTYRF